MAYFKVNARSLKAEADGRRGDSRVRHRRETVVGARPNLVASFPPHIQLQLATDVPVAVDTKNLHFFDEASGAPLR